MGFNKRYINKESLILAKTQGLEYLVKYIKSPDSLIVQDAWSEKICNIILTEKETKLAQKLIEVGFYGH